MPRDAFGVYTLPPGNPVIPNTIIATNWANTTMNDIAAALTASLSVDGSVTTAKLANGAVTTIKIADANVTRPKLSADLQQSITNVNVFINSAFDVWQEATSLGSGTGARHAADMTLNSSVGSTYTCARIAWPVGTRPSDTAGGTGGLYYASISTTSVAGAANFNFIVFLVEGVQTLAGKTCTFSMYARSSPAVNVALEIQQVFGTGGSPSADVSTPAGLIPVTTVFTRVSKTFNMPAVTGKTLGTNGNDAVYVIVWFDAGSNFNTRASNLGQRSSVVDIWGVKLEEGSVATPYVIPDIAAELDRCYRYYYVSVPDLSLNFGECTFNGNVTSGTSYSAIALYPAVMRGIPTITTNDINPANFPVGAASTGSVTQRWFRAFKTASGTGLGRFTLSYVADARLL